MAMRKKKPVRLGNLVVDDVTGLKGTVTSIHFGMSGAVLIGVHPKGKGTDMPKGGAFDTDHVTVKGEGVACKAPDDTSHLVLGTTMKDVVTGYTGVATGKTIFMNGCTQFELAGPVDKDGKNPEIQGFDWKRLETVDSTIKQVVIPEINQAATEAPAKPPKGGPMRDAPTHGRG